ncbi:hypothetical protein ACHAPF_007881 [Botrytis cinerea]
MAPQTTNRAVEMANGQMVTTEEEYEERKKKMSRMGLEGVDNPANVIPGSPFTSSSELTPNEVREKARLASQKILSDWNTLRIILQLHADTLEKRWMKKSRTKRKDLLLEAWPNMSTTHRPDYEAYRQECTGRTLKGLSKFQEAYKWPYINLQDLSSKYLIIFINSRGRNPPSAFARADVDATHLGTVGHFIPEPAFLPSYTLFLDGDKVETYGRLVSWEEDNAAADLMLTKRQFSPGDGLKAFELQEKIYPFLTRCCELILHDFAESGAFLDASIPTGITTDPIVPPRPTPSTVTRRLSSLAIASAEAPYRLPANIDFEDLRETFEARLSEAESYLFDLREDPEIFADAVKDWSEHRNDALLDTNGDPHPTGPHTQDFWGRVVSNIIGDAYSSYETYFLLHEQAALLCTLMEKYKDEISYNEQLPKEYLIAILKLKELLKISTQAPINHLQNIQSSPPLRHHFTRAPQAPGTISMHIMPKDESNSFFHKLWFLLLTLWDREKRDLFGLTNIVNEFEQVIQDPEERKNLSSYVLHRFSDLAMLSVALEQIENYRPWAATFDDEFNNNHQEEVHKITMKDLAFNTRYIKYMDSVLRDVVPYCMPGDGKFEYPANQKRTKQNTEQMILAEKNLDFFWDKFDANWKKLTRRSIDACFGGHPPINMREIERTPAWVEPLQTKATTQSQRNASAQKCTHDEENNKNQKKTKKKKSKTRESSQPSTQTEAQPENLEPELNAELPNVEEPKVKIPHHLMRILNTLFPTW